MKGEQGSKQTHIQQQQHRSQDQSSASTWEDQWCQTTEGHNISPYLGAWIPSFTVTQCRSMHEPGEVQQRNSSPDAPLHEGETNPQIPVPKEPETSNPPTTTWSQKLVINLSQRPLSTPEEVVLSLGLSFAITPEQIPYQEIIHCSEVGPQNGRCPQAGSKWSPTTGQSPTTQPAL